MRQNNTIETYSLMNNLALLAVDQDDFVHLHNSEEDLVILIPRSTWEQAYNQYLGMMKVDLNQFRDYDKGVIACFTGEVVGQMEASGRDHHNREAPQMIELVRCEKIALEMERGQIRSSGDQPQNLVPVHSRSPSS